MRSPVTQLIQDFHALNEVEQKVFLDQVDPQPEQEAPAKKTRKKRTPRTGLPEAAKDAKPDALKNDGQLCTAIVPGLGVVCGETADKLIHDPKGGYAGYHPFESSVKAAGKRKPKGAGTNSERPPDFGSSTSEVSKSASAGG